MPFDDLDRLRDHMFFSLRNQKLEGRNPADSLVLVLWCKVPELDNFDFIQLFDVLELASDCLDSSSLVLENFGDVFGADVLRVFETGELLCVVEKLHEDPD